MMARWASAIITHYTRLAPLKSITSDFKRAVLRAGLDHSAKITDAKSKEKNHKTKVNKRGIDMHKVHSVMQAELLRFEQEMELLRRIVNKMAHQCRPRVYCQNKKTLITHRIAVGFEEAGMRARTMCGWKYARADVNISADPPAVRKQTCDNCLPALRASLA